MSSWRVAIWVGVAILLIGFFQFTPEMNRYLWAIFPISGAVWFYRFSRKRKSWNDRVYGKVTALHCMYISALLIVMMFAWLIPALEHFKNNVNEALWLAVLPALLLGFTGAAVFGIGVYFGALKNTD